MFDRREFLKGAGSAAVAGLLGTIPGAASAANLAGKSKPRILLLSEPGLSPVNGLSLGSDDLPRACDGWELVPVSAAECAARLNVPGVSLFMTTYGSAIPEICFTPLMEYLQGGGNWINLGGVPLAVPVVRSGDRWIPGEPQTVLHKRLGITQSFPVPVDKRTHWTGISEIDGAGDAGWEIRAEEVYELYARFTVTKDFPPEDGSSGIRDAILTPIVTGTDSAGQRYAAPVLRVDRMHGEFAGGRWIFANFRGSLGSAAIRALAQHAMQGASELRVTPSFACCHDGEMPSLTVTYTRPAGEAELRTHDCTVVITDEHHSEITRRTLRLGGTGQVLAGRMEASQIHRGSLEPGLYHISAVCTLLDASGDRVSWASAVNGFWMFDRKLLEGGPAFTTDRTWLLKDGDPYPVAGTTYMASDVHRKFLFEPNPHLWDRDFGEMKSAGVNMIRTGLWTGWRNVVFDPGAPSEPVLRSMDAFLLTARKHGIPVIFTLFAFIPEQWGGENAYCDPRSVSAQREFVTMLARRYRGMNDLLWDLINEPTFCNPQKLWSCRPNYDRFEQKAWASWLKTRYPAASDEERVRLLHGYYRGAPDEPLSLPPAEEFDDVNIFTDRRPVRVIDYRLFAQDAFKEWAAGMTAAIRANGNPKQLVTVGQDEGGTGDSPNPQFFGDAVDFTCIHNWWLNDDLVWDNVITTTPDRPNLVEETGIMFSETMDGMPWRTEAEAARLLERKLAVSVGAGGAGFVEWIWNTNPYMKSDNEAAIGFRRVDGTVKPELTIFRSMAAFLSAAGDRMKERAGEDAVMVIPHSQMFSTRNFASPATKRCVRVMHYDCMVPVSAVSEYRLEKLVVPPRLLIVPSARTLNNAAWNKLLDFARGGSTIVVTGPLDRDDHWMPRTGLDLFGMAGDAVPVAQQEHCMIDGTDFWLSFRDNKLQRLQKVSAGAAGNTCRNTALGHGAILWCPLPLELAEEPAPLAVFYRWAIRQAGITPVCSVEGDPRGILVRPAVHRDSILYTIISECGSESRLRIRNRFNTGVLDVVIPAGRAMMIMTDRGSGTELSRSS